MHEAIGATGTAPASDQRTIMSPTAVIRRFPKARSATLGPADLEARFRTFFESLGRPRPTPAPKPAVTQARRCNPTQAEILNALRLGAPLAADEPESR